MSMPPIPPKAPPPTRGALILGIGVGVGRRVRGGGETRGVGMESPAQPAPRLAAPHSWSIAVPAAPGRGKATTRAAKSSVARSRGKDVRLRRRSNRSIRAPMDCESTVDSLSVCDASEHGETYPRSPRHWVSSSEAGRAWSRETRPRSAPRRAWEISSVMRTLT